MAEVLKKKTSPGENKRKAEVLRSLAEEEARKLEETAGNGNDRDKDEELNNILNELKKELDDNGDDDDEDDDRSDDDNEDDNVEDNNDKEDGDVKSNIIDTFGTVRTGYLKQIPLPVIPFPELEKEAEDSVNDIPVTVQGVSKKVGFVL